MGILLNTLRASAKLPYAAYRPTGVVAKNPSSSTPDQDGEPMGTRHGAGAARLAEAWWTRAGRMASRPAGPAQQA